MDNVKSENIEQIILMDITPHSLGIEGVDNYVYPSKKNSTFSYISRRLNLFSSKNF